MRAINVSPLVVSFVILLVSVACHAQSVAKLEPAQPMQCKFSLCREFDAIVFVHGIYGSANTFTNPSTGYNWPANFPRYVHGRPVDVYFLEYRTQMLAWAKAANPEFNVVAASVETALKPLRQRQYRSIGFIAHSLGGNVVSTYIHMVKTSRGHPQRSQHAYTITLGTPVLGAQIADISSELKASLGMNDRLLKSLKANNLYLTMLQDFRTAEGPKGDRYGCRPVHLHAAYETKAVGIVKVAPESSGASSVGRFTASPVQGFPLNH